MRKFGKTVIGKLILIVCLVFPHKPYLRDPKVQECPGDFQQLEKPIHCYRKYHFCPNYHIH